MTVMRVRLFLLLVCLLRECDGARLTAILVWGWMRCGECRACGWYTLVQVLCLAQLMCYGCECGAWDERSWWSM